MRLNAADQRIAVIGAGTMGAGIAFVAAQGGHRVSLIDSSEVGLGRGQSIVMELAKSAQIRGLIDEAGAAALVASIEFSTQLEQVSGATIVIEAIVEDLDAKKLLIEAACRQMAPEAIFATNTSSLSVAKLASQCPRPERFVGLHFFNPVPAMKLVEVVPGPDTAAAVVDDLAALMRAWRKVPVVARDVPGFIVNNVARPYYGEAFSALEDGLSPEVIDSLLCEAGGFRMGPLALADMIGHDVNYSVACLVHDGRNGKARFRPSSIQASLVEEGLLGRKAGQGIYAYPMVSAINPDLNSTGQLSAVQIAIDQAGLTGLAARLCAAGVAVEADPTLPPGTLVSQNVRMAMGDGRPLAARPDVDVLLDAVRDWSQAKAIGFTARSDPDGIAAGRLGSCLDLPAYVIPDRPGQLVLRTMAQLANAAADALHEQVASAEHIDTALKLGANHPEGPLAWVARVGVASVQKALMNIATGSGDPIYHPSTGFNEIGEAA